MKITEEWDDLAKNRLLDRLDGNDESYNTVLLPIIINTLKSNIEKTSTILDFGCGTGELTYEISKLNVKTVGLDISKQSIELAQKYFKNNSLTFIDKAINEANFDFIVTSMSLMDIESISVIFSEICKNLKDGGKILITITHPCFWPKYWNYADDMDFSYLKEQGVSETYKTTSKTFSGFKTTHFHRPLNFYLNLFSRNNMRINDTKELRGPVDELWYPRFLFFELEK